MEGKLMLRPGFIFGSRWYFRLLEPQAENALLASHADCHFLAFVLVDATHSRMGCIDAPLSGFWRARATQRVGHPHQPLARTAACALRSFGLDGKGSVVNLAFSLTPHEPQSQVRTPKPGMLGGCAPRSGRGCACLRSACTTLGHSARRPTIL